MPALSSMAREAGTVHLEHHVILTPLLDQPGLSCLVALNVCRSKVSIPACRHQATA